MSGMLDCHVRLEASGKALAVVGNRLEETRPLTLGRRANTGPCATQKPRCSGIRPDGFPRLVNVDDVGIQIPLLFLTYRGICLGRWGRVRRPIGVASGGSAGFFHQPPTTRE